MRERKDRKLRDLSGVRIVLGILALLGTAFLWLAEARARLPAAQPPTRSRPTLGTKPMEREASWERRIHYWGRDLSQESLRAYLG